MRSVPARILKLLGIAALLAAVFFLMLFLDRFGFNSQSLFWHAARNFGHAPLFGVIAIVILWLLELSVGNRTSTLFKYAIALIVTTALGAFSEYMQYFTQRDADFMDLMFDFAGAASFLAVYFSIDPRLSDSEHQLRRRIRWRLRIAALSTLLIAAIPTFIGAAASWHRQMTFPEMYTFGGFLENQYVETTYADVEYVEPPVEWSGHDSQVARVTFSPFQYPGLAFKGPYPDWSGYQALTLDIFSPADSTVEVHLMVKDYKSASYDNRYNGKFEIGKGYNTIRIQLSDIENAPKYRQLNLASIYVIHFFIIEPKQPIVLYIDDFSLE